LKRVSPFESYVEHEEKISKTTLEKCKEELKFYERGYDLCVETISCISKSVENKLFDSVAKEAVMVVLPRILNAMQSMRLLRIKGHYYDATIVERNFLESIGLCVYLSSDKEEAFRWMRGKPITVASIRLLDYADRMFHLGKNDYTMKRMYGEICHYVHTNVRAARLAAHVTKKTRRIGEVDANWISLQLTPRFEEEEIGGIGVFPFFATLVLEQIFNNELKLDKRRAKKSKRLFKLFLERSGRNLSKARKNV
jgi:hypothetical protein